MKRNEPENTLFKLMPETENHRRELASRLKERREYLSLSQEEVAQMLRIPRSAISLIENGERKVDALELKKFAEIYQCPLDYFTGSPGDATGVNREIAFLAKAAAKLSPKDREELLRFAQFLDAKKHPASQ
jgi:transcriptional regulator with XRE-family HTH domain